MLTSPAAFALALAVAAWPRALATTRLANVCRARRGDATGESGSANSRPAYAGRSSGTALPLAGVIVATAAVIAGVGIGVVAAAAIVAWALRRVVRAETEHGRRRAAAAGWVSALDSLHADLCAGATLGAALRTAHRGARGDVAAELGQVVALDALGGDVAARLARSPELAARRLGAALRVAARHGVPLAAIVRRAADDVAAGEEHSAATDAALAGPRATALILTCLPLLGIAMGQAMGARPLDFLGSGLLGGALAVLGAAFVAAGLAWTSRILEGARR